MIQFWMAKDERDHMPTWPKGVCSQRPQMRQQSREAEPRTIVLCSLYKAFIGSCPPSSVISKSNHESVELCGPTRAL